MGESRGSHGMFKKQLSEGEWQEGRCTFTSRSGTRLVVPGVPKTHVDAEYDACHQIDSFMQSGNAQTIDIFLKTVGEQLGRKLRENKTVYLNTHGQSVAWLHARLEEGYQRSYASNPCKCLKGCCAIPQRNDYRICTNLPEPHVYRKKGIPAADCPRCSGTGTTPQIV